MKKGKLLSAAALACVLLSGCATADFIFESDPEGAVISGSGGNTVGTAPFRLAVDPDSLKNYEVTPNCYRLPYGFAAKWASGAEAATANPLDFCTQGGNAQTVKFSFKRPDDAPGLETDLKAALKNAQLRAEREAANARAMQEELMFSTWDGWGFGGGFMWGPPVRGHRPPPPPRGRR